jgi:hypothetical protein
MQANNVQELLGKKVKVYFNLHKKKWSIQDYQTRRVIGHTDFLKLTHVKFKVSQAGRERVLREHKKNVHAYAIGTIQDFSASGLKDTFSHITYNPYKYESFVTHVHENVRAVYAANKAWFYSASALVIASGINP